jgi:hypothetical protein
MTNNHNKPVAYLQTKQPGGMIWSVAPNIAIGASCSVVNISGWQISTTGKDITQVTLGDYPALILNQTMNYVMVLSPIVTTGLGVVVDVVVKTSTGRVTTLPKAFTFESSTYTDVQTFESRSLPASLWTNNGTIPWSFTADTASGKFVLYKDGSLGPSENYYTRLLWKSPTTFVPDQGGCTAVASSVKFSYKAYSKYSFCYDKITLSIQQNNTAKWTTKWTGSGQTSGSSDPWVPVSIALPSGTTAINIFVNTAINTNCRYYANGKNDVFFCILSVLVLL